MDWLSEVDFSRVETIALKSGETCRTGLTINGMTVNNFANTGRAIVALTDTANVIAFFNPAEVSEVYYSRWEDI